MKNKVSTWFWGFFFICAGALVVVNQLGIMQTGVSLINLVFAILLAAIIINSIVHLNFFGILAPIAVLCIIFSDEWGLGAITPWTVIIAAVLGSIGLEIIFHSRRRISWSWSSCDGRGKNNRHDKTYNKISAESIDGDIVNCDVRFGAGSKYLHSENLELVRINCNFGAAEVYFDQARLNENGATVEIDASFSGIELYIPREWRVECGVSTVLGGVENGDNLIESNLPTLRINGRISLGGIDIKYI